MICRRLMKLYRNEDIRCSRPTRKDIERNWSVCKPYKKLIGNKIKMRPKAILIKLHTKVDTKNYK